MKVLQGSLRETRYKWPEHRVTEAHQHSPLQIQGSTILNRDDVTYISDNVSRIVCKKIQWSQLTYNVARAAQNLES